MDWIYGLIAVCGVGALGALYLIFRGITNAYTDASVNKQKTWRQTERANSAEKANEVRNRIAGMSDTDISDKLRDKWTKR